MKSSFFRSDGPLHRLRYLSIALTLFAFVLITRLYFVQVVHGELFRDKADRQYLAPATGLFDRGSIYFETREESLVPAATLKSGFKLTIDPTKIINGSAVFKSLSVIITLNQEEFLNHASKPNDRYEEILGRLGESEAEAISKLDLAGVSIERDRWRYYPGDRLASSVLGLIGFKGDFLAGRYGLESYYEDTLHRNGTSAYRNFFAELFSEFEDTFFKKSSPEGSIISTIEPSVQSFIEVKLKEIQSAWEPIEAGGVIIDPKSGEIKALGILPNFNPNSFQGEENPGVFSNSVVQNAYEMGSIIKPLTIAAGIDAGVIEPGSTYVDEGFLVLNGRKISNFDGKGRGRVSMQEVLNQSLNTGAAHIALELGKSRFTEYFKKFGLGEETGVDLPGEIAGLVDNLNDPRDIELATASYGQGIALTPIMTLRALSALANKGILTNPHLVKKISYKVGLSKKINTASDEHVITEETAEKVTRMLVEVVDKALLGGSVKMKRYSIAAKTGTAEIPKKDEKGYEEGSFLHSFFGYFPAYDPKFLVFLYALKPKGANYASETLTHPFIDIAKFLISYYEIPPDR